MNTRTMIACLALLPAMSATPGCSSYSGPLESGREASRADTPTMRRYALDTLKRAAQSATPLFRANALEGLAGYHEESDTLILGSLDDPNQGVRFGAAMLAGRHRIHDAKPTLERMLYDESDVVRCAAAGALAMLGESSNMQALSRVLFNGSSRERAQAAFVLGEIGDASAIPMLLDAADQPIPRTSVIEEKILRLQIAEALVKLGHESSIEPIRASLFPSRQQELEVAALAIQIIGQVEDRRSIDQLIYMADRAGAPGSGEEPMPAEIRLACAMSLAQLGMPRGSFIALEYLENDLAPVRAQAAFTLGVIGDPANAQVLARMVDDPDGVVSISSAAALVRVLPAEVASPEEGAPE
ncbi:MAG: HEAT repeat domain-containing protein [Planctomycetota bacterium]|jgi:HEAT repeat protein